MSAGDKKGDVAPRSPLQVMEGIAADLSPSEASRCADQAPDAIAAMMVRAIENKFGVRLAPMEILGMGQQQLAIAGALMRLAEQRAEASDQITRWEDAS